MRTAGGSYTHAVVKAPSPDAPRHHLPRGQQVAVLRVVMRRVEQRRHRTRVAEPRQGRRSASVVGRRRDGGGGVPLLAVEVKVEALEDVARRDVGAVDVARIGDAHLELGEHPVERVAYDAERLRACEGEMKWRIRSGHRSNDA